jgi:hypothetical protein
MKNMYFLFCFFVSSTALHSMDVGTAAAHDENNVDVKTIIKNDFKNYLASRLKEYQKKAFSHDDIKNMQDTYGRITNKESLSLLSKCLHRDVCDEEGNTFAHLGVKNKDLKMVHWTLQCMKHPLSMPNKAGKEPIDLCIDQLMPGAAESGKEEVYKIFAALTIDYDKIGFDYDHRRSFLKKIVMLEFEHIKHGSTDFVIKDDITKYCSGKGLDKPIVLSEIYQEVCDENGNTFTHILVSHHLSDMLYKFIEKGYITFAPNKNDKMNPITLAQNILLKVADNLFEQCAPNKSFNIEKARQEEHNDKKKCCYYMLLNVLRKQGNMDFKQCCDKHIIEKN